MSLKPAPRADFKAQLAAYDLMIRSGRSFAVLSEIRAQLVRRRPPREFLLPLAQFARRAGKPSLSIQLLRSVVRPHGKLLTPASDSEKCEYAAALIGLGVINEADRLLAQTSAENAPETLLIKAFACFGRWNYREAIPFLRDYIAHSKLNDYQKLVGRVNLAAALVNERETSQAHKLLQSIRGEARKQKLWLLLGNALELSAQNAVFSNRLEESKLWIQEATNLLPTLPMLDGLYVRKWRAIIALMETPRKRAQRLALLAVRAEAEVNGAWETVRDCEMFLALAMRDRERLLKVYFGTPYPHFRERLLKLWKDPIDLPPHFDWTPDASGNRATLDLGNGDQLIARELKPNQLLAKLLRALSSDLYKPLDLSGLHNLLFHETYFDPASSAQRLHQLLRRLRSWIQAQGLDLELLETQGRYRLVPKRGLTLRLPANLIEELDSEPRAKLQRNFQSTEFSLSEAAKLLNLPPRTLSRLLKGLIDDGSILQLGVARATRYVFTQT